MIDQLQSTFRLADAADIAFVSLFLYALFMWFKSTASRPILIGVGVLAAIYLTARAFDMYMTAGLFQAGLAFAAVAAIVVFQEDLRRAFVHLASLGRLPRLRGTSTGDPTVDILVEMAFQLARKKIGALLVMQGDEPLDRHIQGGWDIDARISKALLDSIFDPHSMGHDGAVIIRQHRIERFGARLPLSLNLEQIGTRGTRHCAALGLSEVADALVIVVSEEHGEVSVAENGKLEPMTSPMSLKNRLERHATRGRPSRTSNLRRQLLIENPGWKIASVLLACIAWFLVSFEAETIQKTFVVPIEYRNLPDRLDIDDTAPSEVRITLSGFERAFNLLVPSTLKVSLDLARIEEGRQQIAIEESYVKIPSGLTLFRTTPRIIEFGVHSWVKTQLAVEPRMTGRPPETLRLRKVQVVPEVVQVSIWNAYKTTITTVSTEPIELGRLTESTELKVKLVLPQYIRLEADQSSEVRLHLEVVPESA